MNAKEIIKKNHEQISLKKKKFIDLFIYPKGGQ